ncbi:arabinan endo-1,5-alpha-L-arabinosidase [Microbacterium invictum]|uniref:Arabinan endo-1,5-alpha-L-arabinosidase n=1 Tax=Microbacterium invictum TaxID=515415 RepID=A0AA40SRN4_9MICO|nr:MULTISPECIES: arabinan endo-1,5-alpha-L-arabinosidase [Microbacterium]MBB4141142.1 arabinan endo-1,5-alpha-L-arabinosidase [Microbacterium invictum]
MTAPTSSADPATWGARNAHDPTIVRGDDGIWYMFSTDAAAHLDDIPAGAHVRTSPDLVDWTFVGTALDGVPDAAREHTGAVGLWAPEVVRWPEADDARRWHMYYSASSFGSRTSAIGLATAPQPRGPWTDEGIVVATAHDHDGHNAIDAAVVFDREGAPWLTYGSFFGGIHTLRLDPATGRAASTADPGTLIARRPSAVDGAVEGAYIDYDAATGRYVLYVSYDSLFDTYSMRVGVAAQIEGPYVDATGLPLLDPDAGDAARAGTKILGGHRFPGGAAWIAPGHNSVFRDGEARFVVHHVRRADDPFQHEAQIRRVHVTASGWPVVSPHPFAGYDAEALDAPRAVTGRWQVIRFAPEQAGVIDARPFEVTGALRSAGEAVAGEIVVHTGDGEVRMDAVVFGAHDPAAGCAVLAFGGLDADGVVWIGSQEVVS